MLRSRIRRVVTAALAPMLILVPAPAVAEVTDVTIVSRSVVADGQPFGTTGPYEKLVGRITFALDPANPQNRSIVDLEHAPRAADGRVHFSSDMYILRPVASARGNGVLLFEIANRGNKSLLSLLNRASRASDPTTPADFGDGFLMREGYTIVWIGWEFSVAAGALGMQVPPAVLPASEPPRVLDVTVIVNERMTETSLSDDPFRPAVIYPPADPSASQDQLTVRDRYWDEPTVIGRDQWRFVRDTNGLPRLQLDSGFDPGRWYRVSYRPTGAVVAGVGLAAIRDAASAFRHRSDMPVRGRAAYAFGQSQGGRFLRQFLYDGFNRDEHNRRVFDAMWIAVAGAARGSFNERFATPGQGDYFAPTRFPFSDAEQTDAGGTRAGLQAHNDPEQRPKTFYLNTPSEYWGLGRAAALIHTSVDGSRDLTLPENVRTYFLAGLPHNVVDFPPVGAASTANVPAGRRSDGQQLSNPAPRATVMRALLRALHQWTRDGTAPPDSRRPRLDDGTLVTAGNVRFPTIPRVGDPRSITGPARAIAGTRAVLPFLVPQVDDSGNDIAGVRDPEIAVPLATFTGWNFRHERVGNPGEIYPALGSYIPFAKTRAERLALGDPRPSIEERYRSVDEYLGQVRAAARALVRERLMLEQDIEWVLVRAKTHWEFATTGNAQNAAGPR